MATCACCGSTVFFGKTIGAEKYCNDKCAANGPIFRVAKTIPDHEVRAQADIVFRSKCPVCLKQGPVDVHASHTIWSAIVMTSWSSQARLSCKPCGVKRQAMAATQSIFLGWWGFPWGIIGTPITVGRNIYGMATKVGLDRPSRDLLGQTRSLLALRSIEADRQRQVDDILGQPLHS